MQQHILNCVPATKTLMDWAFDNVLVLNLFNAKFPSSLDLREDWWTIKHQGKTGACVGYAASGLLKWHFVKAGLIDKNQELSARFLWMANKETDDFVKFPTTFIERAGTQTKSALRVVQKYGCVLDELLPMQGPLSDLDISTFYSIAARLRIKRYYGLGINVNHWRAWIANNGPILARINVDTTWLDLGPSGRLNKHNGENVSSDSDMGHAICIVGYTPEHFILRNSWGSDWGDKGHAYATKEYALCALSDLYGAIV